MTQILKQSTAATVKFGPFVDSTDGVTAETALTISQADIRLSKNGGDIAQSNNVTGATHDELGYYDVPLDTTDTNTLGRLRIAISKTGSLPVWQDFMIVPANVYDSLISGSDALQVHTNEITNGLITAATIAMDAIDADALAADAVTEIQNGLATSDQLNNLAIGSAGVSIVASSFTATTADTPTNTYTATAQLDGTYHIVPPSVGNTDVYYEFNITPNGVPVQAEWTGYVTSVNDSYAVYFYNWSTTTWEQTDTLAGTSGTTPQTHVFSATVQHVGTGANDGLVRLRFVSSDGTTIATDRILMTYSVVPHSLGYDLGAVWVDTDNGTSTGTVQGVDALITNRSTTFNNAYTVAVSLGYRRIFPTNGNTVTLTQDIDGYLIGAQGSNWSLALGGQDISNCDINDAYVTGTATGATGRVHFHDCEIGAASVPPGTFFRCGFDGPTTFNETGDYYIFWGNSDIAGASSPVFSKTAGKTISLAVRNWAGGFTLSGLESGDVITLDGVFGTITLNGADASVDIRGTYKALVDNRTGSPTLNTDGAIKGADVATILADTAELQSDWTDGGRLDSILDAVKSVTDLLPDSGALTSLATAASVSTLSSKVLKYFQLLFRKDSAIATDNATELTAINADGGSGAGAYANTTDSVEAIRDRGDAAWVTATGFSTHSATDVWTSGTRTLTANTNLNDPTAATIADAVWDEVQAGHTTVGTFGKYLDTEVSGVGGGSAPTAAAIADAVWDEVTSGHVTAGTFGKAAADILDDTGTSGVVVASIATDAVNAAALAADAVAEINDTVDTALSDVGLTTTVTGRIDAAISTRSTVTTAQVNAEVVDALSTDTYAEPTSAPAATASLAAKIGWLMKLARNKLTQNSSTQTLYADDGTTADNTATVADDGTTFSRGEWS